MTDSIHPLAYHFEVLPYQTVMHVDQVDGSDCYVAENPELPGCIAQGSTQAEALECLKDARLEYISSLLESGQDVPQPTAQLRTINIFDEVVLAPIMTSVSVSVASTTVPSQYQFVPNDGLALV